MGLIFDRCVLDFCLGNFGIVVESRESGGLFCGISHYFLGCVCQVAKFDAVYEYCWNWVAKDLVQKVSIFISRQKMEFDFHWLLLTFCLTFVDLQKLTFFLRLLKNETIKAEELEEMLASTVDMDTIKLRAFLEEKGFNQKDIETVAIQIEKYRRFRVRFIIGNVIGALFFLTSLIVFILLGVEAFRLKSGLVSGVGSVLEGFAGVGTAVNEKMGDHSQKVRELVEQFARKRGRGSVADDGIPLQNVDVSISGLND